MIGQEHSVDNNRVYAGSDDRELLNIQICYNQIADRRYTPRSIFVDLDSRSNDEVLSGPLGGLFNQDNFISGLNGTGSNWAKGHYTDGMELKDFVMDQIRKECETCDCLQGLQFNHSISGGTGSGMGTRLISSVREEYPDRIMESTTVFPSTNISDSPVEPYNSVLSVHQLVENCDFVNVIQNQSLYNMLSRSCNIVSPSFDDFNYIIGCQMSDFSSSLRFSGYQNTNMRKTLVNIVPFPRLHFFGCSFAPLTDFTSSNNSKKSELPYPECSTPELVKQIFQEKNMSCKLNLKEGTHICCFTQFRGRFSICEAEAELYNVKQDRIQKFKDWIPSSIGISRCDVPRKEFTNSAMLITNHTSINENYKIMGEQFTFLFRKKAFLHWYTNEGMDEMEFTEAESNLNDLHSEYIEWGCWADVDEEEGEEAQSEVDQF